MQLAIAPAAFAQSLAAAREDAAKAAKTLALAVKNATVNTDLQAFAMDRDPAQWAMVLRQMADIAETIPALRAQAKATQEALEPLEERACFDCHGTGSYWGPTSATRRGHAYCFRCNGTGEKGRRA